MVFARRHKVRMKTVIKRKGTDTMNMDVSKPVIMMPPGTNEAGVLSHWKYGSGQDIGARKQQQDDFLVIPGDFHGEHALLALIADGMGGMHDGALYSRIVRESHMNYMQKALNNYNDPVKVLPYLAMHAQFDTKPYYDEDKPGGTTLVSALFIGEKLYILSIGDSRITLFRRPGRKGNMAALQLNREHTLGVSLDERAWMGYLSLEDAEDNIYRDSLTSSIGAPKIRHLDLTTTPIRFLKGDRLVLMSDGIYRSCSEDEMSALLEQSPEKAAHKIIEHIREKKLPRQDNNTIVIIEHI